MFGKHAFGQLRQFLFANSPVKDLLDLLHGGVATLSLESIVDEPALQHRAPLRVHVLGQELGIKLLDGRQSVPLPLGQPCDQGTIFSVPVFHQELEEIFTICDLCSGFGSHVSLRFELNYDAAILVSHL